MLGALPLHANEPQDNFLIIRAYSGPVLINSTLEALYQDNRLFVPVSYLSDDIEVPITYDAAQHALVGWFENESNTVKVDFNKNTGRVGKNMFDFSPNDYLYYEDELYLSTDLVDKLLNTLSEFDFANQSLKVTTAGNLPFDLELSRLQKQQHFDQLQKEREAARQEQLNKDVYMQDNWLQPPFLDVSARYSLSKNKGQATTDNLSYTANASFLTGGFDSEFNAYASSTDETPVLTFKTAREDETGHILGLFKHLEMGDTYSYSNPENTGSVTGIGFKMSTESIFTPDGKTYTFRDTLPLGWQVELYRNNELLGYQNQTDNGYFEFADIPLLLGKNKFKLVFYGPQGQTKEREQIIFFNGNILDRGKGRLNLSYINKNRYLIQTRDRARDTSLGRNASISAGYGLTNNLTLNLYAMADSLELYHDWPPQAIYRKDKEYVGGDLSLFAYGIFTSIGTVVDLDNSAATLDLYGQTSLLDWDITLEHIYYGKAILARNIFHNTSLENETTLRLNKTLSLFDVVQLPFSYAFHHFEVVDSSNTQTEHTVSVSQSLPFNIYLNAHYQYFHYFNDTRNEQLTFTANRVQGPWTLRGNTTYNLTYDRLYNMELSAYRSLTQRLKIGARYAYQSRSLSTHNYENLYSANLSYLTKYGYISFEVGTSNRHNSYAFVGYNVSFLPDWRTRNLYATGSKLQGTGALAAFAYMDTNNNKRYDPNETVLPEADFNVKPRVNVYDSHKRNEAGYTMLTHLSAYRDFDVDVDISEIDDTLSLLNTTGTRTIKLRPAQVAYLSFPIVATGDMEGTVYRVDASGKKVPFRGALINLYKDDELINNKVSEYDGYYSFPQVPLGTYEIRLDPAQAQELELKQTKPITVTLEEVEQLEVRDIVLTSAPKPVVARPTVRATAPAKKAHVPQAAPVVPKEEVQPVPLPATMPEEIEESANTASATDSAASEEKEEAADTTSATDTAAPEQKEETGDTVPSTTDTYTTQPHQKVATTPAQKKKNTTSPSLWKKVKNKSARYYNSFKHYAKQKFFRWRFKKKSARLVPQTISHFLRFSEVKSSFSRSLLQILKS